MGEQYEIHVKEHIDLSWDVWFDGFMITHQADGTTTLTGVIRDQPALYGLLMRINQLGLSLLRVEKLKEESNRD